MDIDESLNVRDPKGLNGLSFEAILGGGRLRVKDAQGRPGVQLSVGLNVSVLTLGGNEFNGHVVINRAPGQPSIILNGRDGDVVLNDDNGKQSVRLSGPLADVILRGADAAEDFEIHEADVEVPPGTVMVIDEDGRLRQSTAPYDHCVAGVIAGAGNYRPGIVLGRASDQDRSRPIALIGKTYCRVSADTAPISVGDLLTSSPTAGHAMKATDAIRSHGAVLGKALAPLIGGCGQIPILIALQ